MDRLVVLNMKGSVYGIHHLLPHSLERMCGVAQSAQLPPARHATIR
jgi:hypothetical protein